MSFQLRILRSFVDDVLSDLRRPHDFAFERVGFASCRTGSLNARGSLLLPIEYHPVLDTDYLRDRSVGARINSSAIRRAMQHALENDVSILHVHLHGHAGRPTMSAVDRLESQKIVPAFFNVRPHRAHGALILSDDSASAWIWKHKEEPPVFVEDISIVGTRMRLIRNAELHASPALRRQTFLGEDADRLFQTVRVAIVGLGGGGSHVVQQLVHLGVTRFLLFDPDSIDISNLNRLVGSSLVDVKNATKKVVIAERYIKSVNPKATVELFADTWQTNGTTIREADVIFGCVDTFSARQELEATARRYLIPYIDIGMDVACVNAEHFMCGQVIVSIPGRPCMKCMGFLTDEKLGKEAAQYGQAGERPQVVWANGALASNAVGKFVQILTSWAGGLNVPCMYDTYDGNSGRIIPHPRMQYTEKCCEHHPLRSMGDPVFV